MSPRRALFLALLVSLALPALAQAGVQPAYDLSTPDGSPFPSDHWTTVDWSQPTGLRVELPKPDCAARPSDCADIDVLNTLDGFNVQPRISIPFDGPIDVSTVSSDTVYLVDARGARTGIDQIVWEPAAKTLHFESDEQLAQDTTYLLVVSRGVHAADGSPLDATRFRHDLKYGQTKDRAAKALTRRRRRRLRRTRTPAVPPRACARP